MKMTFPDKLAVTLLLQLAIASSAYPDEHTEHDHKEGKHNKTEDSQGRVQHDSHEHGAARLTVAKTDQGLEIMLESPAANLFGFEHKAHDKKEHETVLLTKEKLEAGESLFITHNAAKCKLEDVDIESDMVSNHEQEKHGDEDKDDHHNHKKQSDDEHKAHDHDEENKQDHAKHDEEDHKGDDHSSHDHEKAGAHSDVEIAWVFKCENPAALQSIETKLFSQFPQGFEHLNVEWITNDGAGALKLKSDGIVKLSQ